MKTIRNTCVGCLIGLVYGYAFILFVLLLIFGSQAEIAGIIFLTIFVGSIYGIVLGLLCTYYSRYVNKFCILFASLGLLGAAILSMFFRNIVGVFIIGLPILFALCGTFLDKKYYEKNKI